MSKPYVVVFSGVPGSSKTPIACYLSIKFNLPIINTDQIRYEVREDMMADSLNIPGVLAEYTRRLEMRLKEALTNKQSFILDGSVDRRWTERRKWLVDAGYQWFMIDLEFSKEFLKNLFTQTGRAELVSNYLDSYYRQHQDFLAQYGHDITIKITDDQFKDRLSIAANGLQDFLDKLS